MFWLTVLCTLPVSVLLICHPGLWQWSIHLQNNVVTAVIDSHVHQLMLNLAHHYRATRTLPHLSTNFWCHVNLQMTPHILVFWRPDLRQYSAYLIKQAPAKSTATDAYMTLLPNFGDASNSAASIASALGPISQQFEAWQVDINDQNPLRTFMKSIIGNYTVGVTWASFKNRTQVTASTVGRTNQMVAADCGNNCLWDGDGLEGTGQDVEFTIEHDRLAEWVQDVKSIFNKDLLENGKQNDRVMGPGYLWIRFGKGSKDYLATNSGLKRPVYVQSTWSRSLRAFQYPLRYGFVPDLIEMVTLDKYVAGLVG